MTKNNNQNNTQQAFWVGIGSLFSFGFTIVSSMILSRYFDKGDYGTYKQVIYVYNSLLIVFTLGIPKAFSYFLPRVPLDESKSLISKLTNLFYILGAIFSLLLFLLSDQIAFFLKNPDLGLALRIFSPVPLLMLPTMGLESILSTYRKTQFITIYTVSTRIFSLVCIALPVIFFKGNYIHAIIGFVISSVLTFLLAIYLKYYPVRNELKKDTQVSYKEILTFSMPLFYASVWGIIIVSADQFFISRFFGNEVFAEFSNGSIELPFVGMVVGAGATVLSPIFSKQIHVKSNVKKEILPLWISVFEKTAKIIYPLVIFFWFFADVIMIILFGDMYENSAIFFRIKLIVNLFTMISYAPLILAIGATGFYARVHFWGAIVLVASEYASILLFDSPQVIIIVSVICQIARIFTLLLFLAHHLNISVLELFPLRLISKILFPSIMILALIRYLIEMIQLSNLLAIVIGFLSYCMIYLLWSYYANINYLNIIKPLFSIRR